MAKSNSVVKIQSTKNQLWVAHHCIVARSFLSRLKGLIGTCALPAGEGLLLSPCREIHMWFMSIPIDVVFLRRSKASGIATVSSLRSNLLPWRLLPVGDWSADETLELPVGTVERCNIQIGDELCIS